MPYQLRMQSVTKKSGTFVQVAGVVGVASAGALVGDVTSAAIAASPTNVILTAAKAAVIALAFITWPPNKSPSARASSRRSICAVVILQGWCDKAQGRRRAK